MIRINLLPRIPRRRLPGRRFLEAGLPLVTIAVVILWSVVLMNRNAGIERRIQEVDRQIAEIQPVVARVLELDRQIAQLRAKEQVILELVRQQLPAASVLNEVRLLIPRDAWVTSLSVPEPEALGIDGFALTYPTVAQFMDNLSAGQLFRSVDLTVTQTERIGAREVVRYSVTARIQKPQAGGQRP
ncbi:MAG: PilN domain-containing protein [Armatimonadota bacterium]|nr:PilN domain-containing protein [Armatimonadota bacterium]MDR7423088.1 PilN domain-containing protein [Armatimonadota bacterium]MDR7454813.1 PilN domain-containing protein [Armatimonadota bacterium]MDR7457518.1 PilN domain-containing protein [Armatimonadota bacterium]MDR7497740.1 PilN domain-containing protein [Armatimonadota bacterium]